MKLLRTALVVVMIGIGSGVAAAESDSAYPKGDTFSAPSGAAVSRDLIPTHQRSADG